MRVKLKKEGARGSKKNAPFRRVVMCTRTPHFALTGPRKTISLARSCQSDPVPGLDFVRMSERSTKGAKGIKQEGNIAFLDLTFLRGGVLVLSRWHLMQGFGTEELNESCRSAACSLATYCCYCCRCSAHVRTLLTF